MALEASVLKLRAESAGGPASEERLVLGKTGWFLLEDEMTVTNMNFVGDICYKGAARLAESVKTGKPEGLKSFAGAWTTLYEAVPFLPEKEQKSWFGFNHFYSDIAFPEALPIVFANKPRRLFDIGGNTARWAIRCCRHDPDVRVTIIELPGPAAVAEKNAGEAGFAGRISIFACDILDEKTRLPAGADAVFMSQFLTAFSLPQITKILAKIHDDVSPQTDVYILDPLVDKQRFEAASYVLRATALYFTCMANGRSSFYRSGEYIQAIEDGGFTLHDANHSLRWGNCSLLHFRKKA
jgi:hypothetical protein